MACISAGCGRRTRFRTAAEERRRTLGGVHEVGADELLVGEGLHALDRRCSDTCQCGAKFASFGDATRFCIFLTPLGQALVSERSRCGECFEKHAHGIIGAKDSDFALALVFDVIEHRINFCQDLAFVITRRLTCRRVCAVATLIQMSCKCIRDPREIGCHTR